MGLTLSKEGELSNLSLVVHTGSVDLMVFTVMNSSKDIITGRARSSSSLTFG